MKIIKNLAAVDRHGWRCKNALAEVFALQKFQSLLLAGMLIVMMTACDTRDDDNKKNDNNGPTHFEGALEMSGQVWNRSETYRVNEASYSRFSGNDTINIVLFASAPEEGQEFIKISAGSGEISNGIMNFTAAEPEDEYLLEADDLKKFFAEWDNVEIDPIETKGNNIMLELSDGKLLNREGLFGTKSSVGLESILFIYVDRNCRITGDYFEGAKTDYFVRTEGALNLSLKEGWNTVCRKEALNAFGYVNVAMKIKNPNNFKWAIVPAPQP